MIEVWRNLAVDDDAWERYCKLKGIDPKTAERPVASVNCGNTQDPL